MVGLWITRVSGLDSRRCGVVVSIVVGVQENVGFGCEWSYFVLQVRLFYLFTERLLHKDTMSFEGVGGVVDLVNAHRYLFFSITGNFSPPITLGS